MKKLTLSIIGLLIAGSAFSQALRPVQIDSLLTISLPANFTKKDTLNQEIYAGNGLTGYMMVVRQGNAKDNQPLKKEKDLKNVFKKYITDLQGQSDKNSILKTRDTTVGTLEGKAFTVSENDEGESTGLRDFLVVYTRDATYTFQYVYPINRKDLIKEEEKGFFSSIKLSPELQRNDQYLFKGGSGLSTIAIYGISAGALMIIIIVMLAIIKRRSNAKLAEA